MERQLVYRAIQVEFESPLDNGTNKCNVKHYVMSESWLYVLLK
jgi:hypothetical protein